MQPIDYGRQVSKTHLKLFCATILTSIKYCSNFLRAFWPGVRSPGRVTTSDTDPNAVLLADVTEGPEEQRSFGLQSAGSTAVQAAFKDESADTAREPELAATHSVCSHMATYASPHHQSTAEKIWQRFSVTFRSTEPKILTFWSPPPEKGCQAKHTVNSSLWKIFHSTRLR